MMDQNAERDEAILEEAIVQEDQAPRLADIATEYAPVLLRVDLLATIPDQAAGAPLTAMELPTHCLECGRDVVSLWVRHDDQYNLTPRCAECTVGAGGSDDQQT